ncbi:MAG TPA: undecaprenyldiphospho-muramoylpentapeptide beta-N-acetylglucosaminyltransferase [Candidatus Acidoferrum sp.]|nr:undecaprenyldiphospho-muramoylpentapeptide beta-N-acetylglucosaminyltransferase [Candidatus Acidoferrum sp.]
MKLLLSGGGTAGHINPAIAIADFFKARHPDADIRFVGTDYGIESKLVPKAGYRLYTLEVYGLRRKLDLKNIRSAVKAYEAIGKSKEILREFAPDLVIGTGGYISGPVVWAACDLKIPTAIHEQNAFPGLTTKYLARRADRLMISFDTSRKYFRREAVLVGNPIHEKMLFSDREAAREKLHVGDKPLLVTFGGSMGSRPFNEDIMALMRLHAPTGAIRHIHAAGQFGIRWMPGDLKAMGVDLSALPDIDLREYIYDMDTAMAAADLVITRAGAITLGEIAVMGKPSILIPSPNVTNNHQYYNAKAFADAGAALLIEEKDCTGALLWKLMGELLADRSRLSAMSQAAHGLAIYDSAQRIYDAVLPLLHG